MPSMLSIPAEVLPRFCPDPRAVAALALTCGAIAARLRESRPVFVITKKCSAYIVAESLYYKIEVTGTVLPGCGQIDGCCPGDCTKCVIYTFRVIFHNTPPCLLLFTGGGLLITCDSIENACAPRYKQFAVYQLHSISTTQSVKNTSWRGATTTLALSWNARYPDKTCNASIFMPGTLIYKRVRDYFCARACVCVCGTHSSASSTPTHLAARVISLCFVSRA